MGCSLQVSPGRVTCFHLALSSPSSSLSPTVFMFSFTTSINLLFGSSPGRPPACLPVPASAFCHWYIHYPSSAHIQSISVWPLLSGFISKTSNRRRPPDVLSPDPIHPARSQQRRSACFIWMSATSSSASCLFPPPPPLSLNRTASQPSPPSHALFLSSIAGTLWAQITADTFLQPFQAAPISLFQAALCSNSPLNQSILISQTSGILIWLVK